MCNTTHLDLQDAYPSISDSILATQIIAGVYLHECDYQNSIIVAENGLTVVTRAETDRGRTFPNTRLGFKVVLATSLVHLFPPKHHARALFVLDEVLIQAPNNTACLMGRAYILQHEKRWDDAAELFARVGDLLPDDLQLGIRAKEELAWCQSQAGELQAGIQGLEDTRAVLTELEDAQDECARCLWRIGKSYWDIGGKHSLRLKASSFHDCEQMRSVKKRIATSFYPSKAIPHTRLRSRPLESITRNS